MWVTARRRDGNERAGEEIYDAEDGNTIRIEVKWLQVARAVNL